MTHINGCDSEDAIKEGAAKLYNLITGASSEEANTAGDAGEFALMGVTSERVLQRNQLSLKDKIRVLSIELENTSNLLKHSERINTDCETAKKDLQTKLDNYLVQTKKWRNSSKNLFKLIDSSMSVKTKVGLGFTNCISENELGWDDSAFSVFTTNSEDLKGRPIFHMFAKTNSMKVVPPPLTGDYTSLSDHTDLDESQMSYGTKSSTNCDPNYVPNDFVSCGDSDKSSDVNSNDFASNDSSVKSSEHMPTDSTSCASTSSETAFLATKDEGIFDSGCSRSMAGNKERLDDFQAFHDRKVTFGGGEGRITGKGTMRTPTLDFENVYYVKELQQFNLFSISHIYDKNNQVLFTDTECLVLSKDFKLRDDSMVVLKVLGKHNLYTINLNDLCPRAHKDETYHILKDFINLVENQLIKNVKAIKCDNVRTSCYVLNRVSVTSPHNQTPYALLTRNILAVSHFKPFGCHVTILNTSYHLGKFDGKADKGYIVGYSASNKAYRVYNVPIKRVEESLNLRFLKEKPNV
nr:retrovirus-related Pol polyprotein from transposon TNT 1-94 [Tanacetum cinerariifolium]